MKTVEVMLCCKEEVELEEKDVWEKVPGKSRATNLEIREWALLLRENRVTLDNINLENKEQSIKDEAERANHDLNIRRANVEKREREMAEERAEFERIRSRFENRFGLQRDFEEREEILNRRHQELLELRQNLRRREFELNEKGGVVQIVLKLQEKNQLGNDESEEGQKTLNEREFSLVQQEVILDQRETKLQEESAILEIAVRISGLR